MIRYYREVVLSVSLLIMASSSYAKEELYIVYSYERALLGELFDRFSKQANVSLQADYATEDIMKSTLFEIMEKRPPDVLIMPADQVGLYSFAKYSAINHSDFVAKISQRALDAGVSDGKMYGEPLFQGNHLFLYYNKSFVKEPAKDWSALLEQKADLDAKNIATIIWPTNEPYYLLPFLSAYGGWPLVDGNIQLNTPAMISALDFYHSLQVKQLVKLKCDLACTGDMFRTRKAAYVLGGVWDMHGFYNALGDDLGVTAMPLIEGRKMLSPFSTYIMAFPNNGLQGPKRDKLIKLVNFIQSTATQQELWERARSIPVEAAAFDYVQANAAPHLKAMLDLMADTKPLPADQIMTYIWDAMRKGMLRNEVNALDGAASAMFMQKMAEKYQAQLESQAKSSMRNPSASQASKP